jgi:hypothetical protein
MKFAQKAAIRIILPILVAYILEIIHGKYSAQIPHEFSAFIPFVAEFFKFGAYAGIASMVFEEIIRDLIFPEWINLLREELVPPIREELEEIRTAAFRTIMEKGITFQADPEMFNKRFLQQYEDKSSQDPLLTKAIKCISHGDTVGAIRVLEGMPEKKQEYMEYLLTAYASSTNMGYWVKAESMLSTYGIPYHYIRLGFSYWERGIVSKAISLTEEAYKKVINNPKDPNYRTFLGACKNSLAYYYADGEIKAKKDIARRYIEEEVADRKAKEPTSPEYANTLDTRGYVKITFEEKKGGVMDGMKDCEEAKSLGANEYLYHRHLARAHRQLSSLSE